MLTTLPNSTDLDVLVFIPLILIMEINHQFHQLKKWVSYDPSVQYIQQNLTSISSASNTQMVSPTVEASIDTTNFQQ